MQKIELIGMRGEKSALLDLLQGTGSVEIKPHCALENTLPCEVDLTATEERLAETESALAILTAKLEEMRKRENLPDELFAEGFVVPYADFMAEKEKKEEREAFVAKIMRLNEESASLKNRLVKCEKEEASIARYLSVPGKIGDYADTAHAMFRLGLLPRLSAEKVRAALAEIPLSECLIYSAEGDLLPVLVLFHKEVAKEAEKILSENGFAPCTLDKTDSAARLLEKKRAEKEEIVGEQERISREFSSLASGLKDLKIYRDYLAYSLEKQSADGSFVRTEQTFFLEGYVPSESVEELKKTLDGSNFALYYRFSPVGEEDDVPSLMKNNPVVSNFESVTNLYSPPNYRELDPNAVMAFFYSLFMGFIVGDAGYGLLMTVAGLSLGRKKKDTGFGRLCMVFGIGGIFAVAWGLMFNSFFGFKLPMPTILPDAQNDSWTFAGIRIPAILILSLMIGVVQLMAGYILRAAQYFRRKQVAEGICFGISWAVFSLGVLLALIGLTEESSLPLLTSVGGIMAAVSLLFAMLTAGRGQKFGGRLVKGFGSLYGIINYVSDILSYARLYGLMLSGAIFAGIVSRYSAQFILGGTVIGVIGGILLLVIGHGFNIAMNLLGAYIHDSRLQYVEFFGRFFEGEGRLFSPIGANHKYISVGRNEA